MALTPDGRAIDTRASDARPPWAACATDHDQRGFSAGHGETDGEEDQGHAADRRNALEGSRDPGCSAFAARSLRRRR